MWRRFLLITIIFYLLLRVLFFVWNHDLYQSVVWTEVLKAFLFGFRFDLSSLAFLALPSALSSVLEWLFQMRKRWLTLLFFLVPNLIFIIINLGEIEYIKFTGRRMTLQSLAIVSEVQGKLASTIGANVGLFVTSCILVFLWLFLIFKIYKLDFLKSNSDKPQTFFAGLMRPSIAKSLFTGFIILFGLVIAARGGLQKKPLGFAHSQAFANSSLNLLMLNSSFTFLQSLKKQPLAREHFMSREEMLENINGNLAGESIAPKIQNILSQQLNKEIRPQQQNVILIIVESLTLDMFGKIHGDKGYVPFLDELSQKSLFFTNAFANGRRSIEGAAAILAGIPAMMTEPFISSQYATNTFYGLGTQLGSQGYVSAFYHGAANGSMYFDQFTASAGIPKYFGANEYDKITGRGQADNDGTWGIWDRPFLQTVLNDIDQNLAHSSNGESQKFSATIFTLSSHTPFQVPESEKNKYPKGTSPIHEVMGYTDSALQEFFAKSSQKKWFNDTLFIITGDHTFTPSRISYQNEWGQYRVPIIFYHPRIQSWPTEINVKEPVQHIDILPSITDFLGFEFKPQNLMGRSVFREGDRYVVIAQDGLYHLINKDMLLRLRAQGGAEAELFRLPDHLNQTNPNKAVNDNSSSDTDLVPIHISEKSSKLLKLLNSQRQYFSEGLWDNSIYR